MAPPPPLRATLAVKSSLKVVPALNSCPWLSIYLASIWFGLVIDKCQWVLPVGMGGWGGVGASRRDVVGFCMRHRPRGDSSTVAKWCCDTRRSTM